MFNYNPLWETMKKRNINQYQLIHKYGLSTGTLDALRQNRSITMNTLDMICQMLDCNVEDVVKIEKDNK